MISLTGIPAKNSFVQNDLRPVCEVIHSYFGLTTSIFFISLLIGKLHRLFYSCKFPNCFLCLLNSGLVSLGIFSRNWSEKISFTSFLKGITTQCSDFSCFLYKRSFLRSSVRSIEKSENLKPDKHANTNKSRYSIR